MAVSRKIQRWRPFDGESEQGFRQFKDRVYGVPQATTLDDTDVNMQEGDTLPDDSTYEIISSKIDMVKPLTGKNAHRGGRAVVVRAMKEKVEGSSQTPWQELSGTRTVLDSDPQTIRYEIRFTASTGTALPTAGQTISDVIGSGSLTSTNLDREPDIVSVSARIKATVLKDHVVCVFQAHHARTTTGSPFTEINPRQRTLVAQNTWKGRRRFSVPIASAANLESTLFGSMFPGLSGQFAPICGRVSTQDNWEPGRSLVIADYETPRVVGQGVLRVQVGFESHSVTKDLDGKVIVGPEDVKDRGIVEHRLVSGSATRLRPMATIILETAATGFNVNTFLNRVGKVNKYRLPNFGNAQPGTLLFLGAPQTTFRLVGSLWYLNLAFKYSGDPSELDKNGNRVFPQWNEMTKSQSGSYVMQQVRGVTKAGTAVAGADKFMRTWVPKRKNTQNNNLGAKQAEDVHRMFPTTDLRDLGRDLVVRGL
tara:strand:+ start:231 stop:1670 length:1440 start_codon:yes stop_codon:yes gene_type:complete